MLSRYTTLFHATGEPFDMQCGIPPGSDHFFIKGADIWHAESDLALIILQEVFYKGFLFRYLFIDWKKAGTIACQFNHEEDALVVRTVMHKKTAETIVGAGRYYATGKSFYPFLARFYTSLVSAGNSCRQHYFDTIWYARRIYADIPELDDAWNKIKCGMPCRIPAPKLEPAKGMENLLNRLLDLDYRQADSKTDFRRLMRAYLKIVRDESFLHLSIRKSDRHYETMSAIRDFIAADPLAPFTLEELAKKFYTTVKNIERKFEPLVGLSAKNFRRYLLTSEACRKKIETGCTWAELLDGSGYKNGPSLMRGMIIHLGGDHKDIVAKKWTADMPLEQESGILNVLNELLKW